MEYISNSLAEIRASGEALAVRLIAGTVVAFIGDLEARKTAFTRGLTQGLGVPDRVTSPTFTIVNEYEGGRLPLSHFDMYRLGSFDELFDIRWEDYLAWGGMCAVEWSEIVSDALEDGVLRAGVRRGAGEGERIITIIGGTDVRKYWPWSSPPPSARRRCARMRL